MWEEKARNVDVSKLFTCLTPKEVLIHYDGPATFTSETKNGMMLLAHQYDETDTEEKEECKFFVVPCNDYILNRLKQQDHLPIKKALNQPWIWLITTDFTWRVIEARMIDFDNIPELPALDVVCAEPEMTKEELGQLHQLLTKLTKQNWCHKELVVKTIKQLEYDLKKIGIVL